MPGIYSFRKRNGEVLDLLRAINHARFISCNIKKGDGEVWKARCKRSQIYGDKRKRNYEAGNRRRWADPECPGEIDSSAKFTFHRIIYMKKKPLTSFCDGKISVSREVKSFDMELGQSPGANQDHWEKHYSIL